MSKGFGGPPGNLQAIMKQAQKLQEQLKQTQEKAETMTAEASAGGGMIKVVAQGNNQIVSMKIEKEVVNPDDVEMLEDLVCAAVNEALQKVQDNVKGEMEKVAGGMAIPGLI